MNRREALVSTGSMVVSASLGGLACGGGVAVAQNTAPPAPATGASKGGAVAPAGRGPDAALLEAAHGCLAKGDACIAHCITLLAAGDTSMGDCMKAVRDMAAVMHGLAAAASSGSAHLAALARVAMEFCKDCEAACRKHAAHHIPCRDCADACAKTVTACQRTAG